MKVAYTTDVGQRRFHNLTNAPITTTKPIKIHSRFRSPSAILPAFLLPPKAWAVGFEPLSRSRASASDSLRLCRDVLWTKEELVETAGAKLLFWESMIAMLTVNYDKHFGSRNVPSDSELMSCSGHLPECDGKAWEGGSRKDAES